MPMGPGKYDEVCTLARELTDAKGVVIIVLDGNKGHGFSVQGDLAFTLSLPAILEDVARNMRRDARNLREKE